MKGMSFCRGLLSFMLVKKTKFPPKDKGRPKCRAIVVEKHKGKMSLLLSFSHVIKDKSIDFVFFSDAEEHKGRLLVLVCTHNADSEKYKGREFYTFPRWTFF